MKQIDVVGLSGDSPLSLHPSARMALEKADILYGSERQLALVPGYKANYRQIPSPFSQLQAEITQLMTPEHAAEHMVLLASGDPLFYGIGGWLTRWIKGVNLCFHPQPSAIQLA
ncbi:MAG TPA: cobalamin biosynthesis bifunctional protein CbiET, partial [Gammaproteobacteria bacterium]|nr:cobalamin biosynthesis bifunctional protein CbiET [Gammaproteobacteria bacterium]